MYVERIYPTSAADWDPLILRAAHSNLLQSHYFARLHHRIDRATPVFLQVVDAGEPLSFLLLLHKLPYDRHLRRVRRNLAARLLGSQDETIEWLDGPVFMCTERLAAAATGVLLDWIEEYVEQNRRIGEVRCQGLPHISDLAGSDLIAEQFLAHNYSVSSWGTFLVDLTADVDVLWKNLNRAARKCINKCRRENVQVRHVTDPHEYWRSYARIKKETGHPVNPKHVAQAVLEEDTEHYYARFVAMQDNQVLATLGAYLFNGVATEVASSLSHVAREASLPAQDLLHWELMLYAKTQGCHTFDLAGVNPDSTDPKDAGIRRFKEKWGGRYVEFYRYEKRLPPRGPGASLYETLRHAKQTVVQGKWLRD